MSVLSVQELLEDLSDRFETLRALPETSLLVRRTPKLYEARCREMDKIRDQMDSLGYGYDETYNEFRRYG